jgi:hypothetical protein
MKQTISRSNNAPKTRGRPFTKGNNYGKGRPAGSRNRATVALQSLLDGEAEHITRKAVQLALQGDTTALRICMERLIPPARDRKIKIRLPKVTLATEMPGAVATVLTAVAHGRLTPTEGQAVSTLLEFQRRALETADLEIRLEAVEQKLNSKR